MQIEFLESGIALSQSSYIDKILKRFGMFDYSPVTTPTEYQKVISKNTSKSKPDDIKHYQQLIGSLIYAVMGTRPNLSYVITKLSQYMTNPSAVHLSAAKRVLRLPETKNYGIDTDNPLFLKDLWTQILQVAGILGAALRDTSFNLGKQPSAGSHGNNDPYLLPLTKQNTWHFAWPLSNISG